MAKKKRPSKKSHLVTTRAKTTTEGNRTVAFPDSNDPHVIANCILSILELPDHPYRRIEVQDELANHWRAMPATVRDEFGGVFPMSRARWRTMAEALEQLAGGRPGPADPTAGGRATDKPDQPSRALALLVANSHLTVADIAEQVGCHKSTLYRNKRFMDARAAMEDARNKPRTLPRGSKDKHGKLEAW